MTPNYNDPPRFDWPAIVMIGCLLACLCIGAGAAVISCVPGPQMEDQP